jgi:hypothetical protein
LKGFQEANDLTASSNLSSKSLNIKRYGFDSII